MTSILQGTQRSNSQIPYTKQSSLKKALRMKKRSSCVFSEIITGRGGSTPYYSDWLTK